jgi:isoleucyl-tRNA synthetase
MQNVLDIVVLGRACRNTANVKNRQPLSKIFVCAEKNTELSQDLLEIAKDELNVKEVEYLKDASKFVSYKIKPQLKTLGPKYGKFLGKIRAFLENCNANEVVATVKKGEIYKTEIDGEAFEFSYDDLLISSESMEGYLSANDNGLTIVMDTHITEELKAEGMERELISKIQSMRKDAGFEVTDRINVFYKTEFNEVKNAFTDRLKSVVLADSITSGESDGYVQELDVNGLKCVVTVQKVK